MELLDKILMFPIIGIFFLSIKCTSDKDILEDDSINSLECFSIFHLTMAGFSIFNLIVLIIWGILV